MQFSSNVDVLKPSATLGFAARARELKATGKSIVDLTAGELAFPTPEYASRAGIRAIEEGRTKYPPTPGIPELRSAAAAYLEETTAHAPADPSRILPVRSRGRDPRPDAHVADIRNGRGPHRGDTGPGSYVMEGGLPGFRRSAREREKQPNTRPGHQ